MNRREMLLGTVAAAAALTAGQSFAAEHDHAAMSHEHHHGNPNQKLAEAAADCVLKAQFCLQHCLVSMGRGETELAACARSASETATLCAALQGLATADSKHLAALARVAMEVCKDCEEECKKTDKHPECKACGEACAACYKECKKLVG
ncbi:MAG: four-helix bundle copper-binding protein [Nitrosomonadales bacterium]|nr:four-helix bundle copper-binding protein [Nitrosomonadales bacterium]